MAARTPLHPDAGANLALALIACSSAPILLLDGEFGVVAASESFCRAFEVDPSGVTGSSVFDLGAGEWNEARLRSLLRATLSGAAEIDAYEIDLVRPGQDARRLVLNARLLDYADREHVRLLLTVSDVTDARLADKLKDDLLREKAILLQEVQHRVANSLQIIASVLMQNARKVSSDETRGHLRDAHNRVMSVAAVQRQLAVTRTGEVGLREYLTNLCASLGASMIGDHDQLSLSVTVDGSMVKADVSVSLGLIVTELVINALKHAFPHHRHGKVVVDYRSGKGDWALSVSDDGVGMVGGRAKAKAGLGTSIVDAVANQLEARVEVSDGKPGTVVGIIHTATVPGQIGGDGVGTREAAPAI